MIGVGLGIERRCPQTARDGFFPGACLRHQTRSVDIHKLFKSRTRAVLKPAFSRIGEQVTQFVLQLNGEHCVATRQKFVVGQGFDLWFINGLANPLDNCILEFAVARCRMTARPLR